MAARRSSQWEPVRPKKTLVLCFDGTGNKFSGTNADSNVIKIFSMLDRQDRHTQVYYQPGIGTYDDSSALTKTSHLARFKSAYSKAKDSAIGSSFDIHVRGAYMFLMRFYEEGGWYIRGCVSDIWLTCCSDDLYFFGFSRGAYTARFLAQMLDSVGLLKAGNEEMFRFAWKAFSQWQTRMDETAEQKHKKRETYHFMKKFRETFARPVRRIRFLGLFDTVNSVPAFENAWMQRAKFPYTAKSSAKHIRHAVAIDERRAKFRQNLVSQQRPHASQHHGPREMGERIHEHISEHLHHDERDVEKSASSSHMPKPTRIPTMQGPAGRFQPRKRSMAGLQAPSIRQALSSRGSVSSLNSATVAQDREDFEDMGDKERQDSEDEHAPQDIQEIWFPGCHADIGGGWPLESGEDASLSHAPLLWMIREARKAGLHFDLESLQEAGYMLGDDNTGPKPVAAMTNPQLQVEGEDVHSPVQDPADLENMQKYYITLNKAATEGRIHDSLQFGRGTPAGGVITWNIMEYMPFRRMDLQVDGTWAPIRWPLPCGETRDIPKDAWIHISAIERMRADEHYRPGNLIVGGGGRGVRTAPKHVGMGEWKHLQEEGDPVGGVVVRADIERVMTKEE